jgi:hypothetical protein
MRELSATPTLVAGGMGYKRRCPLSKSDAVWGSSDQTGALLVPLWVPRRYLGGDIGISGGCVKHISVWYVEATVCSEVCCAVLCCALLCCVVLYYAMLCCATGNTAELLGVCCHWLNVDSRTNPL